jgi:hypothetical protein
LLFDLHWLSVERRHPYSIEVYSGACIIDTNSSWQHCLPGRESIVESKIVPAQGEAATHNWQLIECRILL